MQRLIEAFKVKRLFSFASGDCRLDLGSLL